MGILDRIQQSQALRETSQVPHVTSEQRLEALQSTKQRREEMRAQETQLWRQQLAEVQGWKKDRGTDTDMPTPRLDTQRQEQGYTRQAEIRNALLDYARALRETRQSQPAPEATQPRRDQGMEW